MVAIDEETGIAEASSNTSTTYGNVGITAKYNAFSSAGTVVMTSSEVDSIQTTEVTQELSIAVGTSKRYITGSSL